MICLALAALGCGDGRVPPSAPAPASFDVTGTLVATMALEPQVLAPGSEFVLRVGQTVTPSTVLLGAYRVELHFDPSLVRFVSADETLQPWRASNVTQAAAGSVTVAGASLSGFTDGLLFRGTFQALSAGVSAASFRLILSEAVDTRLRDLTH